MSHYMEIGSKRREASERGGERGSKRNESDENKSDESDKSE
jgi:hypothetical protein